MIVRGKQGLCADALFVGGIFEHGARNAHAVKRRSAAANFIQNQKGIRRGIAENICHFIHFYHKGTLPTCQII